MKYFYQNYEVTFRLDYCLSDLIAEYGLENYEIVSVHQQGHDNQGNYQYMIIFRVERS
jgi:hypothetical protein